MATRMYLKSLVTYRKQNVDSVRSIEYFNTATFADIAEPVQTNQPMQNTPTFMQNSRTFATVHAGQLVFKSNPASTKLCANTIHHIAKIAVTRSLNHIGGPMSSIGHAQISLYRSR